MPKISLWNNKKDKDYFFIDRMVGEYFNHSATGVLLHRYEGPKGDDTDLTTIQDVLFLENRDRKYSKDIIELRGHYAPQDSDFDLSQFGIFLTNDTVYITLHYNNMLDAVGRKVMSGDVIELPHLRDPDLLDPDAEAINRFYVIEDASHSSQGYGAKWWSHIWRIKAKMLRDSPEYSDILGEGGNSVLVNEDGDIVGPAGGENDLKCSISTDCISQEINDRLIEEAEKHVKFDPKFMDATHLWVEELSDGTFCYYLWAGDGIPPNGSPLAGMGEEFPDDLLDGEFFLRTDFTPDRLFRKKGNRYIKIEDDMRKKWTAYNTIQDTFIDNKDTDVLQDGSVIKQRQALSKVVKPKVNSHESLQNQFKDK